MSENQKILEVKDLVVEFNTDRGLVTAVSGVNFEVFRGKTIGIVGESGSGKTTLANIILGIYQQDEGEVLFENKILIKNRSLQLRKLIQFVQQNPMSTLNPKKTIYSTIALPLKIHKIVENNKYKEKVEELLSFVGLESNFMDRYPDTLSGGQKQRVAIARALATEPKVIILDEPTSALDVIVQSKVLNLLLDIKKKFDLTYIFITHDLSVVKNIANKVVVMNKGKIEETGETIEIFQTPKSEYTKTLIRAIPTVTDEEDATKP